MPITSRALAASVKFPTTCMNSPSRTGRPIFAIGARCRGWSRVPSGSDDSNSRCRYVFSPNIAPHRSSGSTIAEAAPSTFSMMYGLPTAIIASRVGVMRSGCSLPRIFCAFVQRRQVGDPVITSYSWPCSRMNSTASPWWKGNG
ncbi:hypothetical protein ACFQ51_56820 [Streptomyces kaempferi]